ncbi:MAG: ABC transporter ATP-binding protein [Candidatus Riflebacteria bacterium]|nr:ABC transporter ATP-binding protein [Candidatus Riflebacteria bacterium]
MFEEGLLVRELKFGFSDQLLLQNVSFELKPRECVALLGSNGGGKTTLLRLLTGFLPKISGLIKWDGKDIDSLSPPFLAKLVSLVELMDVPFFSMSVIEMIRLGRSPHLGFWGNFSSDDERIVQEVSENLGLGKLLNRSYQKLSLGEKQRVVLGIALVSQPKYLLLDEPTSHLDPRHQRDVIGMVRNLSKNCGVGVLAVLHDINLARFFDRVIFLHNGCIVADASPNKVLSEENLDQVYGKGVYSLHDWEGLPVGILRN